jgi:tetratricopeptide (TPR) repeat protein
MRRVVRAHPRSRDLRVSYARLLTEAKRYKEAQKQFEHLLRQKPNDTDILYALSLLALEGKKYKVAEYYLKKMIKSGTRMAESYYYLGLIAEQRRRYDAAISWLSKVRKGDRVIDSHLRIATIMSKKGDVEAARRFLYQLKPRTKQLEIRLYLTEADILQRAKRYTDALEVINNALTANPNHMDLLYTRAMMAEKINRIDIVEKDLKIILEKNPKNAQALNALGYTLADRTKRYQEAYDYIRRALELSPNQAAIIDSMGWVQYRMGNYKDSIKHLRRALSIEENAEIAAHLGEVLWVSGDKKGAKKVWQKAIRIDSNNKVLRATLKRFNQ